jgi:hypothetical protein
VKSKLTVLVAVLILVACLAGCGRGPADRYRAELGDLEFEIEKLEIIGDGEEDSEKAEKTLLIAYKTEAEDREQFNQEIFSLIEPSAQEEYKLIDIMIIAINDEDQISRSVVIKVEDVREWVQDNITRQEFVGRWTVGGS